MAKVFNGNEFLDKHAVELSLSNGKKFTVREIMPNVMAEIGKMESESTGEDSGHVKKVLGMICETDPSDFDGIGMVETKGAVDFLLANLFDMKPQA